MDDVLNEIYEEYQRVLYEATDMYLSEWCCNEEEEEERNKEDDECLKYVKKLLETVKKKKMENNGWILASKYTPGEEYENKEILVFTDCYYYDTDCFDNGHWSNYNNDEIIAWKPIEECKFKG